jgi:hypothetical protein
MNKTLIFLISTLVVTGFVYAYGVSQKPDIPAYISLASVPATPLPETEVIIPSPDGKNTLTVKEKQVEGGVVKTFSITDVADGSSHEIFSKTVDAETSLTVPQNTFSPDNKYIFLKEENDIQVRFFSLPTNPNLEKENKETYFTDFFQEQYPEFKIQDVTGWGGMTLIVINTKLSEDSKITSFWYDVASGSFIRLSSRFE